MDTTKTDLKVLVWAINRDARFMRQDCAPVLETAARYGLEVELFGIGVDFTEHKQRVGLLRDFLRSRTDPGDTIYLCMDGRDTLINGSPSLLLERFLEQETRVLISAERSFTWQFEFFRENFDRISSPYRYVNAGTFMGYGDSLLEMLEAMLAYDRVMPANDQGLLGMWAHQNLGCRKRVKLDAGCNLFWVTTLDWDLILESDQSSPVVNPLTNTSPGIIHGISGRHEGTKMEESFRKLYRTILSGENRQSPS